MKIYLIRHTTPDIDANTTLYGQTDLDVVHSFHDEVATIKETIEDVRFNSVYYSPLKRCQKLAACLKSDMKVSEPRLKEISYGDWEMKKFAAIKTELSTWSKEFDTVAAPNGESLEMVQERLISFWNEINNYKEGEKIAIVAHGVVMRVFLAHFLEMPLKNIFRLQFNFGKVIQLSLNESGRIHLHL
ncbi:alpha-ribazole phosphatase family protein [Flammeovirga aprica]|uniref:phosphoglycerate mutase (2,3-diphosphoglycerate-dependent) n=1 Tax=Flammeovirga aprica JL-4 TaxID=694437 RepID=A0A7X9XAW5_9BACT|nr:alpha-ribazole phosphatase family protein [Flammeovirga aprica]NME70107.1 alpha-ribazole phosphatase family protein [Flammeovirga aprica JL-4]